MARIKTYAIDATPTIEDKVIGTNVDDSNLTQNYKIGDIIALVPGGLSSVQSLNTLTGDVKLVGAGGISISASGTDITITGSGSSGGIQSIDGATGPAIDLAGKGGITVTAVGNLINIDGSGISGGTPGEPLNGIQVNNAGSFGAYNYLISNPTSKTLDLGDGSIGKGGSVAGIVNLFNGAGDQNQLGSVRWYDFLSSNHYVGIVGPGSMEKSVSYDIALPGNEPSANQILAVKNGATSSPWELVWTNQSVGGEDVKFKIEATDSAAGYYRDKVFMGAGLTQTFSTDVNGFKTVQLNQTLPSIVNSIKVGSSTAIGTFEFTGSGVTMTPGVPNVIDFAGGTTSPAGVAGSVQINDGTNFSADTNLTWDTTNNILTVGNERNPVFQEGILLLKGNGSNLGGRVQFQTGIGKAAAAIVTLQGPEAGVKQEISLPGALPSDVGLALTVKSITGTEVETEWRAAGGGVSGVSGTAPVNVTTGTTPVVSMAAATTNANGYLTSTDYNTFNSKQGALTLTTQNTSGAATLSGNTLNIPQYAGGSSGPGGSPTQIQYNNNGTLDGDAKFTLVPNSAQTTVTIGNSTNPSASYGLLKLTGNGGSEGGKIQLETGAGKLSAQLVTLQAPDAGVAQTISLPDALPTADTQILGIKSISGTTVQTQWETPSGGGGAVTSVTTNGSTGASVLSGGVLNIPNYTFGNGISYIGGQKTIGTQQIPNNALTLISFGNDTVFKNADPNFGTIQTETDSQGIKASEISFSGAESVGNYWIVMNVNFESGTADAPVMYAEVEGSPASQKLVEMTTEVLPANGSTNKHNYYKCFRYIKSGADKQTVHLQVYFPSRDGGRGQTIAIPSPVAGMAQAPSASVEIWKN